MSIGDGMEHTMVIPALGRRWRFASKLLFVALAGASGLLLAQPSAYASPSLSSIVLSKAPLPGFEPATSPPVLTGRLTSANGLEILKANSTMARWLGQFLVAKKADAAYARGWISPSNGGSIQIVALSFDEASYAARIVASYYGAFGKLPGISTFDVAGIPGADGYSLNGPHLGTPQYAVVFSKGNMLFVVQTPESSSLTRADALKVAAMQFAAAGAQHPDSH